MAMSGDVERRVRVYARYVMLRRSAYYACLRHDGCCLLILAIFACYAPWRAPAMMPILCHWRCHITLILDA